MTTWHFDPRDTGQQRTILRSQRTAQAVRAQFPAGTRVRARETGETGTVDRHVPGTNAQGGYLVITWDRSGVTGRHGPIAIEPAEAPTVVPKAGMRFEHARFLNPKGGRDRALCTVTRVIHGRVYWTYTADYDAGDHRGAWYFKADRPAEVASHVGRWL